MLLTHTLSSHPGGVSLRCHTIYAFKDPSFIYISVFVFLEIIIYIHIYIYIYIYIYKCFYKKNPDMSSNLSEEITL
jgi:hypothetical protein